MDTYQQQHAGSNSQIGDMDTNADEGAPASVSAVSGQTALQPSDPAPAANERASSSAEGGLMNTTIDTSTFSSGRGSSRPLIKLSVHLLKTFTEINTKYYLVKEAARQKKREERRLAREEAEKQRNKKKAEAEVDSNYIVRNSERLNERYVVTPVSGERTALAGKGSFGKVVTAWDQVNKEFVAIKIVKRKRNFYEQAQVEIEILQSLRESDQRDWNVVEMKDSFVHKGHQCIVFELLQHNLYEVLQYTRFVGLSLALVRVLAKQLLTTLYYLGSKRHGRTKQAIIHCDLKPENILLRKVKKAKIKVIDFGSACFDDCKPHSYIQSRFYRAPEILLGCKYSTAIDMFSLGCILFELRTGKPLFDGANEAEQMVKQIEVLGLPPCQMLEAGRKTKAYFVKNPDGWEFKDREKVNNDLSIEALLGTHYNAKDPEVVAFVDLMQQMLNWDVTRRITPVEALSHPFMTAFGKRSKPPTSKSSTSTATASASTSTSTTAVNVANGANASGDDHHHNMHTPTHRISPHRPPSSGRSSGNRSDVTPSPRPRMQMYTEPKQHINMSTQTANSPAPEQVHWDYKLLDQTASLSTSQTTKPTNNNSTRDKYDADRQRPRSQPQLGRRNRDSRHTDRRRGVSPKRHMDYEHRAAQKKRSRNNHSGPFRRTSFDEHPSPSSTSTCSPVSSRNSPFDGSGSGSMVMHASPRTAALEEMKLFHARNSQPIAIGPAFNYDSSTSPFNSDFKPQSPVVAKLNTASNLANSLESAGSPAMPIMDTD